MKTGVWITAKIRVKGTDLHRKAMKTKDERGNKKVKQSEVEAAKERP